MPDRMKTRTLSLLLLLSLLLGACKPKAEVVVEDEWEEEWEKLERGLEELERELVGGILGIQPGELESMPVEELRQLQSRRWPNGEE